MKVSIRIVKSEVDKSGLHPIIIEFRDGKLRKKKKIGVSKISDWDYENAKPLKTHPEFHYLLPTILDYKAKIAKVSFGDYSSSEIINLLFQDQVQGNDSFYNLASVICGNGKTGELNKTVLNSFNLYAPNVSCKEITVLLTTNYMNELLKKNSANGVHTYLRKLGTLFGRVSDLDNPFKGVRPKKEIAPKKRLNEIDISKILFTRTCQVGFKQKMNLEVVNYPRYYWMLMFYLGGIDFIDLAEVRYDEHVINDRLQFFRHKGGTNTFINNKIFPEAYEILKKFDCYPYLVPIHKYKDYDSYRNKCNIKLNETTPDLKLSKKPLVKSARASFIDRAQQLLIDERITKEIVGHTQQSVHSIYTDEFPLSVRDEAHKKIISFI